MKTFGIISLIVSAFMGIHYFFVGVLRSEVYLNVLCVWVCLDFLIVFVSVISAGLSEKQGKDESGVIPVLAMLHLLSFVILLFTPIGVSDNTKMFTIQMTYSDGYTEKATYELPEDSRFYIDGGSRYYNGSDLKYDYYPNKGGLIERNIIRYKVISVKDE